MHEAYTEKLTITLDDGNTIDSDDFVAVLNDENCNARLFYIADAITLGQALLLISVAYTEQMKQLSNEDAEEVRTALRLLMAASERASNE